jgi:hypothetical protein
MSKDNIEFVSGDNWGGWRTKTTPEEIARKEEERQQMGERIRNQEPLPHGVYESSDFKQGLNRGVFMTVKHILGELRNEIESVSNPMMVDAEFLDGLNRAIEIIDEHYK